MRIIKKKERGYRFYSEKFDLSGSYAGKQGIPMGVLLLHILSNRDDVEVVIITAEENGDIGEERNILHIVPTENDDIIENIQKMTNLFCRKRINIWELKGVYCGIEIVITGRTFGTVLSVRTPLTSTINLIPLMNAIETTTYEYHDFDIELIKCLKSKFNLNQKMAIVSIIELEKYPDIWQEFINGLSSIPFSFPENAIEIEGYCAETLFKNYPLTELGAYNYLIYLKNDPQNAINDLKRGLPKK